MAASSLREASLPRFALRRDEAAASLAISPSTFDNWISKGRVPKGKPIDGCVFWDVEQLRAAWHKIYDLENPYEVDAENPFDHMVG